MTSNDDAIGIAIEVLTAWTTQSDSTAFAEDRLLAYLAQGPQTAIDVLGGFLSLSGWLLIRAARSEGESGNATPEEMRAVLQDIARRNNLGPQS
jgi:hypothetical protein